MPQRFVKLGNKQRLVYIDFSRCNRDQLEALLEKLLSERLTYAYIYSAIARKWMKNPPDVGHSTVESMEFLNSIKGFVVDVDGELIPVSPLVENEPVPMVGAKR